MSNIGTTGATPPPAQESSGNNNNNGGSNNGSNTGIGGGNNSNRSRNQNRQNYNRDISNKSFEGAEPSVGAVLGLQSERIDKKVNYEQFKDKLVNYIGRKFDNGDDIVCTVKNSTDPMTLCEKKYKPEDLTADAKKDDFLVKIYMEEYKRFRTKQDQVTVSMKKLYNVIWGQCSDQLQSAIKYLDDYELKECNKDISWLLGELKRETAGIDSLGNAHLNLIKALKTMVNMKQGPDESDDNYLKRMNASYDSLVLAGGGHIVESPTLMTVAGSSATAKEKAAEKEKFLAVLLLVNADPSRYSHLNKELVHSSQLGNDNYPKTSSATYELLRRRSGSYDVSGPGARHHRSDRHSTGGRGAGGRYGRAFQFVQQQESSMPVGCTLVAGRDGTTMQLQCYRCQDWGHLANNCPAASSRPRGSTPSGRSGVNMMQVRFGYSFTQGSDDVIPRSWLLLDTCSTCSCTNNTDLVSAIRDCTADEVLTVHTNGGSKTFTQMGTLNLFPMSVHYNPSSLANVLSFDTVAQLSGVRITLDTLIERGFLVTYKDMTLKFRPCSDGLYYFDTNTLKSKSTVTDYSFLETVKSNKEFFSSQEIQGADNARLLQRDIGWPSTEYFKQYIKKQLLNNCNVTVDDINRADIIYGPAKPTLEGKMTRLHPSKCKVKRVPLPLPISIHHKEVELYIDFFYVNGYPFFITKSSKVNFITAEYCTSRFKQQIINKLETVIGKYETRGFDVAAVHADNEFNVKDIKDFLLPTLTHIYGKDEHVGFIEQAIKTIKERCRCICHTIPFHFYTRLMVEALIKVVIRWLNAFPSKNSISDTMSPAMIVEGKQNPDMSLKRISFGSHAMVYIGTTNTMKRRAVPAIALDESNDHGGYYFMNLYTGKRLHSYNWEELPIDDETIDRVEELAKNEKAKKLTDNYPLFEWAPGVPILDELIPLPEEVHNTNNDTSNDNNDDANIDNEDALDVPNVDGGNENEIEHDNFIELQDNTNDAMIASEVEETDIDPNDDDDDDVPQNDTDDDDEVMVDTNIPLDVIEEEEDNICEFIENEERIGDDDTELIENEERVAPTVENEERNSDNNTSTRPRRTNAGQGIDRLEMSFDGKLYTHRKHRQFLMTKEKYDINKDMDTYYSLACDVMFTQMNAKKGIKLFGERAVAAMFKEYKQLDKGPMPGKPVFGPISYESLTNQEIREALEAVNLIKEKRDGKIKGRTCANGSKQRQYLKEGETVYSPTCTTESLMATLIIDAMEKRDVAIFDVPGAFLQTEMPEGKNVILVIRDEFVDILCEVNPEYKEHVRIVKGRKILYVKILRAIYGCIESAMLWYNLYVNTLKGMGFEINPYDTCVANKMVNEKQCTVVFHVDDNKISHIDSKVVTEIMDKVTEHFGELAVTRGDAHDFLGIHIKMRNDGLVAIQQHEQIEQALDMFGPTYTFDVTSPCANHLWKVNEDAEKLDEEKAKVFHSIVAKLLHVTKRSRPDIETAVAFLMTRVSKSDVDDWKKLKRLMTWLRKTRADVRLIGAKSVDELYVWVDAAFGVHNDMKSQTGGVMSFGHGMVHCRSNKQRLNTKSSTEAEIVGTSEYVPFPIWLAMFMREQGYPLKNSILFQDNESAIKMESNGRDSCTGRSRHIDLRYFFVKDRVDKGEMTIEYCPTKLMIADYMTKPLQGKQFEMFRYLIMGWKTVDDILTSIRHSAKERVENMMAKRPVIKEETKRSFKEALLGKKT